MLAKRLWGCAPLGLEYIFQDYKVGFSHFVFPFVW